ncbi:flavin-containing monooxygenase [Phyllobacterium endophyticum]|uniref:FAD-dependent oxidoreductase n=1 Tax=Phyllobacterium endophyticum TaxID=1149773 RepID=A0A2P7AUU2_9HYPH|nr:NAD(P)/FAD-dependent oxidoreductase [Phyllobacterium endophyticum]MBB3234494.1 putative flavoprotein involved in K+ transport [Phyllobacterium endophyticum]PSH57989.1 FAD-dependent oxidoreductase [Phyllobacterium endophyticum]TYR38657.1 NADPH-dependent L-lysine N(6)-monooxygenase [Phyllobacterium endophyticum]
MLRGGKIAGAIMRSLQQLSNDGDVLDAVVIGAGWAGLGVSYWLARRGLRHSVLERGRVGETWRTQRWDSFRMNTPNVQTIMPGDSYDGPDPDGALTRDQFVDLLESFALRNALPIEPDTAVNELAYENGAYRITISQGRLWARNVIVASGSLNCPVRPVLAAALPPTLSQIDASGYRRASDLPDGAVLVVGSGQSGAQIAEELAEAGRTVFLATSRVGRLPRRYRGRDIMVWLLDSGFLDVPRQEIIRLAGRIPPRGVLGSVRTISLQSLSTQAVILLGRLTSIEDGGSLLFADDLEANARFADDASDNVKRHIDDYISRTGIDAPVAEPDLAETVALRRPNPKINSLDLFRSGVTSVVWCTGFKGDFGWIRIPRALDSAGQPAHTDGIGSLPGLYFAGLDFASTRKSGIILAIAEEAERLVGHIQGHS